LESCGGTLEKSHGAAEKLYGAAEKLYGAKEKLYGAGQITDPTSAPPLWEGNGYRNGRGMATATGEEWLPPYLGAT